MKKFFAVSLMVAMVSIQAVHADPVVSTKTRLENGLALGSVSCLAGGAAMLISPLNLIPGNHPSFKEVRFGCYMGLAVGGAFGYEAPAFSATQVNRSKQLREANAPTAVLAKSQTSGLAR